MTRNGKIMPPLVRSEVYCQAFARLDLALAKNTHSDVAEYEKTRLWFLKIFGKAPGMEKIQR
jgi:hypothetical protein